MDEVSKKVRKCEKRAKSAQSISAKYKELKWQRDAERRKK